MHFMVISPKTASHCIKFIATFLILLEQAQGLTLLGLAAFNGAMHSLDICFISSQGLGSIVSNCTSRYALWPCRLVTCLIVGFMASAHHCFSVGKALQLRSALLDA